MKSDFRKKIIGKFSGYSKGVWCILGIITLIGLILRIICCFWGWPYQLHPDEPMIVNTAINMISRNSWEAYVYNRPDQFEIKCCAIIFQVFSWVKYGMSASEAFSSHTAAFYFLARFYTTFWGTLMIPLSAVFAGEIFKKDKLNRNFVSLATAVVFAMSYLFIQHSAYATPDITLTFFSMAIAYYSLKWLHDGQKKDIYVISALTGIAISIKYPAAVITLYIAFIVIYSCIRQKKYFDILKLGIASAGIILAVLFIIAPNLFTDMGTLISAFKTEMRSTHLGADNLGFWGNLKYYFQTIAESLGYISVIGFVFGIVHLALHRKWEHFPLLISTLFWVCLSVMALHWLRWGFPMYVGYIIISVSGFAWIYSLIEMFVKRREICIAAKVGWGVLGGISALSIFLSAVTIALWSSREDDRIAALAWCNENGITKGNSLYEGYTPLNMNGAVQQNGSFTLTDGGVQIIEEKAGYQYFIMSSSFKDRYLAEAERYADRVAIYEGIDNTYETLFQISGSNCSYAANEFANIVKQIDYLIHGGEYTGNTIWVYALAPDTVSIRPYQDTQGCLAALENTAGAAVSVETGSYLWTIYESDGRTSLISQSANLALDVTGGDFSEGTAIELWTVTGGNPQSWTLRADEDGDYYYLLSENNMALTYRDGVVTLAEFSGMEEQRWIIDYEGSDGE